MIAAPAGKALVICGAPGSGKSSLAQLIANRFPGRIVTTTIEQLTGRFNTVLTESPEVLIIEEFDNAELLDDLKKLITSEICVATQGELQRIVKSPKHIIVCTNMSPVMFSDRHNRFVTLTIGGALCHMPS